MTSQKFKERFATFPHLDKFCAYFEILYGSYSRNWTDSQLLQAKCDAATAAGFEFDKNYGMSKGKGVNLDILADPDRIILFDKLFTTTNLDLMIWWVYEHLGTQWLGYIRGLDLFLNSMRMVGQTVTNPLVEDKKTGEVGEVVEDEMWLKKQKVYMEAMKINDLLMEQRKALFMGTGSEQMLLDVIQRNDIDTSDLDTARMIKESKNKMA